MFFFNMARLLAHLTTPNLAYFLSFNLPGKGDPASSCATAKYSLEGHQNTQTTLLCEGIKERGDPQN
jgi:hypothetical protein